MTVIASLTAQISTDCRVLVLGSMPGAVSLAQQQYYAHPRNRFWPLMGQLCGFDPALPYEVRLAALQKVGIGLWDVLARCQRQGSLDAAILRGSEEVNPLPALLQQLPQLRAIACNGGVASRLFERHMGSCITAVHPEVRFLPLPSTSPANASWSFPALLSQWRVLGDFLASPIVL